jgi:tetratricopeptide (TPR) repeat protein
MKAWKACTFFHVFILPVVPSIGKAGGKAYIFRMRAAAVIIFVFLFFSCTGNPVPKETPLSTEAPAVTEGSEPVQAVNRGGGGIVDEICSSAEIGTPSALFNTLEIIHRESLDSTEFGRSLANVCLTLLKTLYPAVTSDLPSPDPPLTHLYSRILREAERGVYVPPRKNSSDYLEHVLPFLSIYGGEKPVSSDKYLSALPDLERASKLNSESVLAPFFTGIAFEYLNLTENAFQQYTEVWETFPECFPAALGLARVMVAQGRYSQAERLLSDLAGRFPDNVQVKRQLALSYYHSGSWLSAQTAVDEILAKTPRDGEFVLMKAHILVEQEQFLQAQVPLDLYAGINPNNRFAHFLRARVQAEAYNNREGALNYLRSIIRSSSPADDYHNEAAIYAVRLLMESNRPQDQIEGRNLLIGLLAVSDPLLEAVSLAMWDAIRRESYRDARLYLGRLLDERRSTQDLLAAYTVEKEDGNAAAALSFARELYQRDRSNDEGIIAYISALIETGRRDEAAVMIESRLEGMAGGVLKSRYYYLRSQTRGSEEVQMNDLLSSLFEDSRNLNSLIALFEIYQRRNDERRAIYYLRQALALAPDNLQLKRYEAEYALRGGY